MNKISFNIEKNCTVGLLGPNGCGKTTTIGMLLGLVTPSDGEITLENKNISNLNNPGSPWGWFGCTADIMDYFIQ